MNREPKESGKRTDETQPYWPTGGGKMKEEKMGWLKERRKGEKGGRSGNRLPIGVRTRASEAPTRPCFIARAATDIV